MGDQTTTAERIRRTINSGLTIVRVDVNDGYTPERPEARVVTEVVNGIAVELDAKDKRIVELEGLLREHEGVTRDAVAQTLAGNALAGELAKARVQIDALTVTLNTRTEERDTALASVSQWYSAMKRMKAERDEARAQIAAKDARIAETEGLLREGMVMIKNADALRAAVNDLAADVLEARS